MYLESISHYQRVIYAETISPLLRNQTTFIGRHPLDSGRPNKLHYSVPVGDSGQPHHWLATAKPPAIDPQHTTLNTHESTAWIEDNPP